MAVNAIEYIGPVEREDSAALVESNSGCECHDFHFAGDSHDVLAPRLEVAHQLLFTLAAEGGTMSPSQYVTVGDRSCFHV